MSQPTLEQAIEVIRALPLEDRQRLWEWLGEQARKAAAVRQRGAEAAEELAKFQQAMKWLDENGAHYFGQWVALDGDRLISHGPDGQQVYVAAKAAGVAAPLMKRVVAETLPFGGW